MIVYTRKRTGGFALFELLIGLTIFVTLMVITTMSLRSLLDTEKRARIRYASLRAIMLAGGVIQRDTLQVLDRPVLSNEGKLLPSVIVKGSHYVEFTALGTRSPQRIAYDYHNGILYRVWWPVLDRTTDTKPFREILLSHLASLKIESINSHGMVMRFYLNPNHTAFRVILPIPQEHPS